MVHVLAGYVHRGGQVRAVCRCGHVGPARRSRRRAGAVLDEGHRLDPLACAWCARVRAPERPPRRPTEVGLAVCPVGTGPWPGVEHLACVEDVEVCDRITAELTRRYEDSAAQADAYCRALPGRRRRGPVLRLIRGG